MEGDINISPSLRVLFSILIELKLTLAGHYSFERKFCIRTLKSSNQNIVSSILRVLNGW